jgi:hypothetical protein
VEVVVGVVFFFLEHRAASFGVCAPCGNTTGAIAVPLVSTFPLISILCFFLTEHLKIYYMAGSRTKEDLKGAFIQKGLNL